VLSLYSIVFPFFKILNENKENIEIKKKQHNQPHKFSEIKEEKINKIF
jgi:hypothetical protein